MIQLLCVHIALSVFVKQWAFRKAELSSTLYTCDYLTDRRRRYDWVKKCTEYEVEASMPRSRPKMTWREVVKRTVKHERRKLWIVVDGGS